MPWPPLWCISWCTRSCPWRGGGRVREPPLARRSREIAFAAALLWAVHPLQTNAITYIIQRMTSLAALFYLLAVLFYLRGRLCRTQAPGAVYLLLSFLCGLLALASKENSAILPLTILACEWLLVRPAAGSPWSRRSIFMAGGAAAAGLIILTLLYIGGDPLARILAGYQQRDFTLGQRLLTESRVIFTYLSLIVLPLPSRLNIAYDYRLSTGLLSPPQTLAALAGVAVLLFLACRWSSTRPFSAFALWWFLLNLVVESTVIPLKIAFEHRLYVPSVFVIGAGVYWVYRLARQRIWAARLAVIGIIALFALFTWQRNMVWQDKVSLWTDAVHKSPGLAWAYINLGKAQAEQGQATPAESNFRQAARLDPSSGLPYLNLGVLYERQNRLAEAEMMLTRALEGKIGNHARLFSNLALVKFKLGRLPEAIQYAGRAIEEDPRRPIPYEVMGIAYLQTGRYREAEEVFQRALRFFPGEGKLYARLAAAHEKQARLEEALAVLRQGLARDIANRAEVFNKLGIVYWRMGRLEDSAAAAARAIELDPGLRDAYLTLGISYEDMGRRDLALKQFRQGWQKGLDMVKIYNGWAENFMGRNNPDRAVYYLREAVRLEPSRAVSHRNLARAYAMKGMTAAAAGEEEIARRLSSGGGQPEDPGR